MLKEALEVLLLPLMIRPVVTKPVKEYHPFRIIAMEASIVRYVDTVAEKRVSTPST